MPLKCSDASEMNSSRLIIVEVELVSNADKNNWFVFEIELDENIPMARVSRAAEMVMRLPAIPRKVYSLFSNNKHDSFCIERENHSLHRIKYVTSPSSENQWTKLVGYS